MPEGSSTRAAWYARSRSSTRFTSTRALSTVTTTDASPYWQLLRLHTEIGCTEHRPTDQHGGDGARLLSRHQLIDQHRAIVPGGGSTDRTVVVLVTDRAAAAVEEDFVQAVDGEHAEAGPG